MSITNIFLSLFSSFVLAIFHVYCWEKILNYKSKIIFKPCDYVTIILCTLATFLTNILLPQTLKILIVSYKKNCNAPPNFEAISIPVTPNI